MSLEALVPRGACEPVQCVVRAGEVVALHAVRAATVLLDHVALWVVRVCALHRLVGRARRIRRVLPRELAREVVLIRFFPAS